MSRAFWITVTVALACAFAAQAWAYRVTSSYTDLLEQEMRVAITQHYHLKQALESKDRTIAALLRREIPSDLFDVMQHFCEEEC